MFGSPFVIRVALPHLRAPERLKLYKPIFRIFVPVFSPSGDVQRALGTGTIRGIPP